VNLKPEMKAAVYYAPGDVRVESFPTPSAGTNQLVLKVLRSGMCGTDASEYTSGPKIFPTLNKHAISGHLGPMILGHEFIGEVIALGDGASKFKLGDIVASGAGFSCGECRRCKEGRTNLCATYVTSGLNRHGGMAEYAAVEESTLSLVPEGLSLDAAGLAQPLAVGIHAARRAGVVSGDQVVLIGAGAIGTFVLAGLKSLVDAHVTVVDFPGERLERAVRLGADRVVAVSDTLDEDLKALFPLGADVVIEASGAPGQMQKALKLTKRGGTMLQVGLPSKPQEIEVHPMVMSEISIRTTLAHICQDDLGPALEILNSTRLANELVEGVYPLEEISNLLEKLATGQIQGKVLFDPAL
jgi:(R,R)-butanediol dehydrogenase / meso-butanediol dehydrogenase / diacetyl reductase